MLNRRVKTDVRPRSVVLVGFESSGKSALFRGLTGYDTGEEANFRGSTVMARRTRWSADFELVDLPGVKSRDDSQTTQEALNEADHADQVILVVRGTHSALELPLLLEAVALEEKSCMLVLTFADKIPQSAAQLEQHYRRVLGIPVYAVDARHLPSQQQAQWLEALEQAGPLRRTRTFLAPPLGLETRVEPQHTRLEQPKTGRFFALWAAILLFALPIMCAYFLSTWLQPLADRYLLDPIRSSAQQLPALAEAIVAGDYGLFTLGIYSFLWAFPVVLLLGISLALTEESGLKDRITDALDPWMRRIGLNGRDLIPILSGFGCNVVAVFQSRACGMCTRKSCVSLIAFGSACSYQIGASLSIFGSAGHPLLFIPYLLLLMVVGALHTRLWNHGAANRPSPSYSPKTFLQKPSRRAVQWRVRTVIRQFMLQAMPIFLAICMAAAVMEWSGLLNWLTNGLSPLMGWLHLPADAAGGILFSILRKDGLLVVNQGDGQLLSIMSTGQIFVLVYLASTLTACLVTLWTVRKELGWTFAGKLAGRQAITSLVTTAILVLLIAI